MFVQWCIDNQHTIVAQKYVHPQDFPELFPILTKAQKRRFCNDNRKYYRKIYIKTDHWKSLKNEKLSHQHFCEMCRKSNNLDVHHLRYRNLYDVSIEDLKVLCRRCHTKEHDDDLIYEEFKKRDNAICYSDTTKNN